MSVYQPMLYISPATEAGLKSGALIAVGSVVRDAATGRIVEHLREIDKLPTKDVARVARGMVAKVKTPQGAVVAIGGAAVVAVGASATWVVTRPQRHAKKLEQRLNQALVTYLEAARKGQLNVEIVQDTIDAIAAIESHPHIDELPNLTQLGIDQVAGDINRYTHQLTRTPTPLGSGDKVADLPALRRTLELQKAIAAGQAGGHGDNPTPSTAD